MERQHRPDGKSSMNGEHKSEIDATAQTAEGLLWSEVIDAAIRDVSWHKFTVVKINLLGVVIGEEVEFRRDEKRADKTPSAESWILTSKDYFNACRNLCQITGHNYNNLVEYTNMSYQEQVAKYNAFNVDRTTYWLFDTDNVTLIRTFRFLGPLNIVVGNYTKNLKRGGKTGREDVEVWAKEASEISDEVWLEALK